MSTHQSRPALRASRIAYIFPWVATAMLVAPVGHAAPAKEVAKRRAAHCQAPRWAPDASRLAYEVYDPKRDKRETWLVVVESTTTGWAVGKSEQVVISKSKIIEALGGKQPPVVEFEWAPDMQASARPYVFSSQGIKKNFDLYLDDSWLTTNTGNDGQPAWSPDGRYIAFTSQQKDSGDIYMIDLDGDDDQPRQVTKWPAATEFGPRWAPNTNSLSFTRAMAGKQGQDVGIIGDTTRPAETTKMLTDWAADEIRPSWSPDAKRIAFYSNRGNVNKKQFDLWIVGIDGQNAKKLASNAVVDDHRGVVWTPDSSTVIYVEMNHKTDNPVKWVRADGSARGTLETGTQLNSDLALRSAGGQMVLAFKALGVKGSTDKTWERVYVMGFDMTALKPDAP